MVSLPLNQTWNICDFIRSLVNGAAGLISQTYQQSASQLGFLWSTPLPPFQDDSVAHLLTLWNTSWGMVLVCITAVIAWGALRSMVGSVVSWLSYAQIIELLPRLVFALIAALVSKQVFLLLISANNALSGTFSSSTLQTIIGNPNPGIKLGLVQIAYGSLSFVLILEEAVRVALIYILFAGSPLLFFLAALPETQRFAQATINAAILVIFLQAAQSFTMDVGDGLLTSVIHSPNAVLTPLHILVALAVLYLTLAEFYAFLSLALGRGGYAVGGAPRVLLGAGRWGMRATQRMTHALRGGGEWQPNAATSQGFASRASGGNTARGGSGRFFGGQPGGGRPAGGQGHGSQPGGSQSGGTRLPGRQAVGGQGRGNQPGGGRTSGSQLGGVRTRVAQPGVRTRVAQPGTRMSPRTYRKSPIPNPSSQGGSGPAPQAGPGPSSPGLGPAPQP